MKSFSSALRSRPLPEVTALASLEASQATAGHRAWFGKPSLRFFRTKALVRVRLAPLRRVLARS